MKLNIVLSFLVTISLATDYSKHGDDWTGRDEVCKKGYRQSPLNIQENPNKTDSLAFKLVNYHEMRNATINVDQDGSRIIVIDPNMQHSYLTFKNVSSDIWRMFTLRGMQWKVPAEHQINQHQYDAELQIFHGMDSSDQIVALSFLFDKGLVKRNKTPLNTKVQNASDEPPQDSLKTCFVDSFKFEHFTTPAGRRLESENVMPPPLDIPLKEFIEFIPQTNMSMYFGSLTEESCQETVTWLVNMTPHVITEPQVAQLRSLLSTKNIPDLNEQTTTDGKTRFIGGNFRNIKNDVDIEREIFMFNNKENLRAMEKKAGVALVVGVVSVLMMGLFV